MEDATGSLSQFLRELQCAKELYLKAQLALLRLSTTSNQFLVTTAFFATLPIPETLMPEFQTLGFAQKTSTLHVPETANAMTTEIAFPWRSVLLIRANSSHQFAGDKLTLLVRQIIAEDVLPHGTTQMATKPANISMKDPPAL